MVIHSPKELAMFIKNHCKKQKISQYNTANPVGLKQTTVSAFERKPQASKIDTLFRILATTGLQLSIESRNPEKDEKNG